MEGLASAVLVLLTVVVHIWCGEIGAPRTYGEQHSAVLKAQKRAEEGKGKGKESRGVERGGKLKGQADGQCAVDGRDREIRG